MEIFDYGKCIKVPSKGGWSRSQINEYAISIGLNPKLYKTKDSMCQAIKAIRDFSDIKSDESITKSDESMIESDESITKSDESKTELDILYFSSGMSEPWRKLSNLYECHVTYKDGKYLSIEHIYQSLKFIPSDRKRFMIDGDLSDYDSLIKHRTIFYPKGNIDSKIKYWKTRNCVGIVPKLASNPKNAKKLGLTYNKTLYLENKEEAMDIFRKLLLLKYDNKIFRDVLVSTKNKTLVEFSRMKNPNEKWGGFYDGTKIIGHNWMGILLSEVREKLKK